MEELWAEIEEVPTYAVSNLGRIQNLKTGKFLKATPNSDGYPQVSLCFGDGSYVKRTVHKLVATAFIENYDDSLEVNHDDGIKTNNCSENLGWATHLENMRHARTTGLLKPGFKQTPVMIIETGEIFESQHACAKAIGGYQTHISACLYERIKSHRGYTFKFV